MTQYERTKRHVEDLATAFAQKEFGVNAYCEVSSFGHNILLSLYEKSNSHYLLEFDFSEFELSSEESVLKYKFIDDSRNWTQLIQVGELETFANKLLSPFKSLCLVHMCEYIADSLELELTKQQCEGQEFEILSYKQHTEDCIQVFVVNNADMNYRVKVKGLDSFIAIAK